MAADVAKPPFDVRVRAPVLPRRACGAQAAAVVAAFDPKMKRQRKRIQEETNWLVEALAIGVMLACVVMLVAAAHASPFAEFRAPVAAEHTL